MCGLFGWYATQDNGAVDLDMLKAIAVDTESRGRHAYGWAWVNARGVVRTRKAPGAISDHLDEMDELADAVALIGHCRFATRGSAFDNDNNHPHAIAGGGLYVHNGTIYEQDRLVRTYRIRQRSACDSELIGHLYSRSKCRRKCDRLAWTMALCSEGPIAVLALWKDRLLAYRDRKPLHASNGPGGIYLASLRNALEAGSTASVRQNEVLTVMGRGAGVKCFGVPVPAMKSGQLPLF